MNKRLAAIFGVLIAILLIGQRFGFVWAGGTGYAPEFGAISDRGVRYARGETVATDANERTALRIGTPGDIAALADMWLDQNTTVILESTNDNGVTVRLVRGRLYAVAHDPSDPLSVTTNFTRSETVGGALSVVNYDFRETVSIIPTRGSATVRIRGMDAFETEKPVDVHETQPVSVTDASFEPNAGAAADFYKWAIE
ncbi:hypothetical protein EBS80_03405 [bacterium]|nr:hypothetical protein [bacterium]